MDPAKPKTRSLFFIDLYPQEQKEFRTLILIHGAGGSHRTWREQQVLSSHFRLVALDLPGHGGSGGAGEVTIAAYADHIIDFIRSRQLGGAVLGGHSMGGAIALEAALREPDLFGGLVLVGTGARLRVLPAIFKVIREDFDLAVQGMAGFLFGSSASPELVEEQKLMLAENSPDLLLKDFTACDSFDIMDMVQRIALPTLVICGREDRLTSPKYSALLHSKIAGSEWVLLEKCGHMPMLEQSGEFNDRIVSFMEKLKV
jgi:pimeloyl-ACP methyl ester carboxylesterase